MKKTIWSLAALMLMAAPTMTSCSKDLDEIAPTEDIKSNVVTITIAPPVAELDTRLAMGGTDGLTITGWEVGDVITLYKVKQKSSGVVSKTYSAELEGTGVSFKCIDATNGIFCGDLGSSTIDQYTMAVYGAEAVGLYRKVGFVPTNMCSTNLKDVVVMAAYKDQGKFTMEILNNVLKVTNSGDAAEVAWQNKDYVYPDLYYVPPFFIYCHDGNKYTFTFPTSDNIPDDYQGWANARPFMLNKGVSYVSMGVCAHKNEEWGLSKQDGTQVVPRKIMTGKENVKGKIYKVSI